MDAKGGGEIAAAIGRIMGSKAIKFAFSSFLNAKGAGGSTPIMGSIFGAEGAGVCSSRWFHN